MEEDNRTLDEQYTAEVTVICYCSVRVRIFWEPVIGTKVEICSHTRHDDGINGEDKRSTQLSDAIEGYIKRHQNMMNMIEAQRQLSKYKIQLSYPNVV